MYGGPQQPAFASAMVKLGLAKYKDLNGGTPNCVSFTPDVRRFIPFPSCRNPNGLDLSLANLIHKKWNHARTQSMR